MLKHCARVRDGGISEIRAGVSQVFSRAARHCFVNYATAEESAVNVNEKYDSFPWAMMYFSLNVEVYWPDKRKRSFVLKYFEEL